MSRRLRYGGTGGGGVCLQINLRSRKCSMCMHLDACLIVRVCRSACVGSMCFVVHLGSPNFSQPYK